MDRYPDIEGEKKIEKQEAMFPPEILQKCWFLAGPTASGKSAVSLMLADKLNAEILALDSMTIYQEMDIGTAKPTLEDQQRVKHHLLDLIAPHEEYSIANYLKDAEQKSQEIISRGKIPLFVGGTGLYLKAILRGMFTGPAGDPQLREKYHQLYLDSPEKIFAELQQADPVSARRLHINDEKRIIRALEVFHLTGKPLSDNQMHPAKSTELRTQNIFWINPPRDWLYQRINKRVLNMFEEGLEDEVKQLMQRKQGISSTARQGLGYKEVIDYLELEHDQQQEPAYQQIINQIQTRTRQFAKRQHTWFRNLEECIPIDITGTESIPELCELILRKSAAVHASDL